MPSFEALAINPEVKIQRGIVPGSTRQEVENNLLQNGWFLLYAKCLRPGLQEPEKVRKVLLDLGGWLGSPFKTIGRLKDALTHLGMRLNTRAVAWWTERKHGYFWQEAVRKGSDISQEIKKTIFHYKDRLHLAEIGLATALICGMFWWNVGWPGGQTANTAISGKRRFEKVTILARK